jgi:hypothetical protein
MALDVNNDSEGRMSAGNGDGGGIFRRVGFTKKERRGTSGMGRKGRLRIKRGARRWGRRSSRHSGKGKARRGRERDFFHSDHHFAWLTL